MGALEFNIFVKHKENKLVLLLVLLLVSDYGWTDVTDKDRDLLNEVNWDCGFMPYMFFKFVYMYYFNVRYDPRNYTLFTYIKWTNFGTILLTSMLLVYGSSSKYKCTGFLVFSEFVLGAELNIFAFCYFCFNCYSSYYWS